jgi:hypothetical protein
MAAAPAAEVPALPVAVPVPAPETPAAFEPAMPGGGTIGWTMVRSSPLHATTAINVRKMKWRTKFCMALHK